MKSVGFIYGDKIFHYENTKNLEDMRIVRDNNLKWVAHYRSEFITKTGHGFLKI